MVCWRPDPSPSRPALTGSWYERGSPRWGERTSGFGAFGTYRVRASRRTHTPTVDAAKSDDAHDPADGEAEPTRRRDMPLDPVRWIRRVEPRHAPAQTRSANCRRLGDRCGRFKEASSTSACRRKPSVLQLRATAIFSHSESTSQNTYLKPFQRLHALRCRLGPVFIEIRQKRTSKEEYRGGATHGVCSTRTARGAGFFTQTFRLTRRKSFSVRHEHRWGAQATSATQKLSAEAAQIRALDLLTLVW